MKILALSDQVVEQIYSPQVKDRFGDVKLVLGCGDLPGYYLDYVVSTLNVPFFHVPGNHDLPTSVPGWDRRTPAELPLDCGNLDGRMVEEQGLLLAGFGGSVRYRPDGDHQYTQAEMRRRVLALVPRLWMNRVRYGRALDLLHHPFAPQGNSRRDRPRARRI